MTARLCRGERWPGHNLADGLLWRDRDDEGIDSYRNGVPGVAGRDADRDRLNVFAAPGKSRRSLIARDDLSPLPRSGDCGWLSSPAGYRDGAQKLTVCQLAPASVVRRS